MGVGPLRCAQTVPLSHWCLRCVIPRCIVIPMATTRVIVPNPVGSDWTHKSIEIAEAFDEALYGHMSRIFDEGVARFGSVDAFHRSLDIYLAVGR